MESLAPSLQLLLFIKYGCEKGESVRSSLKMYLQNHHDDWSKVVQTWFQLKELHQNDENLLNSIQNPHRRILISVLERGLDGQPIYANLCSLEEEITHAASAEMDEFIAKLPFKMLLPLLLLQFPAYLLLLLGPMLNHFLKF